MQIGKGLMLKTSSKFFMVANLYINSVHKITFCEELMVIAKFACETWEFQRIKNQIVYTNHILLPSIMK